MKRVLRQNINTKEYWDNLLKLGKWGKERGKLHELLAKFFPKNKKITVLDIGCATGHGTYAIAKKLPFASFEACDFSSQGIKQAKKMYGNRIKFFVHDVYKNKLNKKYDYILFIETLEHVTNPKKVIRKYLKNCKKMIVTVPYKEKGWKEHIYSFEKNSFNDLPSFKKYSIFRKPGTDMDIILYLFEN